MGSQLPPITMSEAVREGIRITMEVRPMSLRAVARATKTSPVTLGRFLRGAAIWSGTLDRLYEWVNVNLPPAPAAANPEREPEFCWLIERGQSMGQVPTVWYAGEDRWGLTHAASWTEDAYRAIRFATREEAEAYIESRNPPGPLLASRGPFAIAVEHGFAANPEREDGKR